VPTIQYDGLEFKDEETLGHYKNLKRTFAIASTVTIFTLIPSLFLFISSLTSSSSYVYLVPLAFGGVFSLFSYRANSKLTELLNSDEVRHIR
jgi:hypothetical protein